MRLHMWQYNLHACLRSPVRMLCTCCRDCRVWGYKNVIEELEQRIAATWLDHLQSMKRLLVHVLRIRRDHS